MAKALSGGGWGFVGFYRPLFLFLGTVATRVYIGAGIIPVTLKVLSGGGIWFCRILRGVFRE